MSQLQVLTLHSASPTALPLPFVVERTATLPSLTHLDISASVGECALALAHLDLPALTWLCLILIVDQHDSDMLGALPYIARHAHGSQDIQPLQSILIWGDSKQLDIFAWPVPNIDVEVHDPPTLLGATVPTRVAISFRSETWSRDAHPEILDAAMTALPLDNLVMLAAQDFDNYPLPQDLSTFWLRHLPKWPLLRRVRLAPPVDRGFIEALLGDNGGRESPLLPSLTELVISDTASYTRLCDALMRRVDQGVPLEILDLRMNNPSPHISAEVRALSEIVADVLEPNLREGPEEDLDVSEQMTRRMLLLWSVLACGPFTREDDDD